MPRGTNAPKLCPAEPAEVDLHRVVREPVAAPRLRDGAAEHRADGAVHVADRPLDPDRVPVLDRRLARRQQLLVERLGQPVVLGDGLVQRLAVRVVRHGEDRG